MASAQAVASLLLLADGRFPVGGHAHSAGVEAAILDGRVRSFADLEHFVEGRLFSTGLTEAALAAAATVRWAQVGMAAYDELSTESDARYPTEPLRDASRRLGRQLLRVAAVSWPDSLCDTLAGQRDLPVHQPVALGAVGAVAGITPVDVAALSLHHNVTTPLQAAIKLAGWDPFQIAAASVRFTQVVAECAQQAASYSGGPLSDLPADNAPLIEIAAVNHTTHQPGMFAT